MIPVQHTSSIAHRRLIADAVNWILQGNLTSTSTTADVDGIKNPCVVATTTNITLSGTQTINSVSVGVDDRVLVKDQTDGTENGIYVASAGAWAYAADWADILSGVMVATETDELYIASFTGTFVLGTTNVGFSQVVTTEQIPPESEYDPGYTLSYVNSTTFTIDAVDVTNMYHVNRRLKLVDGSGNINYGAIATTAFSTDTTITMTMETGTVPATLTNAVLTTSNVNWSPIAGDPFGGSSINDITSGYIGATKYWVLVGDSGKLGYSTDQCATITMVSLTTTENLNSADYNPTNQTFMACGQAGVLLRSTTGTTWAEDTTELPALTSENANAPSIIWDDSASEWCVMYKHTGTYHGTAYSTDDGVNFTGAATGAVTTAGFGHSQMTMEQTALSPNHYILFPRNDDPWYLSNPSDTTATVRIGFTGATATALNFFTYLGVDYQYHGHADGEIANVSNIRSTIFGSSQINDFAWFAVHARMVAVSDDGKLGYVDATLGLDTSDVWVLVSTGFNPLSNIMCVHWDADDGIGIAASNQGEICRSTNGIT